MCTEKQFGYVEKLAKWKGKDLDLGKVKEMSVDEVSALIDDLKGAKSVKKKSTEINDIVKGLASKLVVQKLGPKYCVDNKDEFVKLRDDLAGLIV